MTKDFFESKSERQPEAETPKRKRAKNKITRAPTPPPSESRFAHLLVKSESEEETPEEQVSIEYLEALHQSHLEKDNERERKRLALPHFAQHEVPDEPKEIVEFFKDFATTSHDEKIARWHQFKEEQRQYLATWKPDKSKKAEAQGRPERAGGSKRVPTPPPPPARPGQSLKGSTSKAAPSQRHWMMDLQDDRKIGQGPLLLRSKSEAAGGDPSGASS